MNEKRLFKYFIDECNDGYGVFETDDLRSFFPKKFTTNEIKRALKHYEIAGYISIKYSDDKTYCLSPLAKARAVIEDNKTKNEFILLLLTFLFAFLGGFLGTLFYYIIA